MAKEEKTDGRPPRKDVYYLKLEDINIEKNFNVREDFGDIKELSRSIEANGVRVPVRGYKKDGTYWITDGERRYLAVKSLAEKGIEIRIPFLADGRESSEEQRVIDMLICNEGKKLNPVEESNAINRLVNFGYSEEEIRTKTGFSKVYVCNLKLLHSAPKKMKDLIVNNMVSATLAMKILREEKDFTKAQQVLETAMMSVEADGSTGKKKVTDKNIRKSKGKTNSYSALKKVINRATKKQLVVRQDNIHIYEFVQKLNSGDYTVEALLNELFEPEIIEEKPKKNKNVQMAIPAE